MIPCLFHSLHGAIDHRCGDDGQAYSNTNKKQLSGATFDPTPPVYAYGVSVLDDPFAFQA
jgi:hypothetical protein